MNEFQLLPLSSSKRPILEEEEIECLLVTQIAVYERDSPTKFKNATVAITTHRILFMQNDDNMFLHLSKIKNVDKKGGFFSSPRIIITLQSDNIIRLSMKKGRLDEFYEKLVLQVKKKSWVKVEKKPKKTEFTTRKAGISGIIRDVESKDAKNKQTMDTAFQDLNSLMEKAKEMVELANLFSEKMKAKQQETQEEGEFKDWLITMGIASPVTKKTAGALYHQELAKQLADFLEKPLDAQKGMMTLVDAYCIYNRARGTDLISPEDMYRACSLFDRLGLQMTLRHFEDSNVVVIQSRKMNFEETCKKILELIAEKQSVTPMDVSHHLGISVILAKEQLLYAEKQTLLCRDETIEGIRFYENFFMKN